MTYTVTRNDGTSFEVDESAFDADRIQVPVNLDALDQNTLNAALTAEGSVVRALALLVLQEINVLRKKASLPEYTQAQLVTALKAKMR